MPIVAKRSPISATAELLLYCFLIVLFSYSAFLPCKSVLIKSVVNWDLLVVNALTGNSGDEWQNEMRNFMHTAWNIVISTSVCLCVCLSVTISPEPHARSLPNSIAAAFVAKGVSLSAWKQVMGVLIAGEVWSTIAFWSQNCKCDIKIWKVFPV